jgi:hypothetical protein
MLFGERGGDHPMEPHIAMMKALQRHEPKAAAPNRRAGNAPRSIRSFGDGNTLSMPLPQTIPQATLPKKRYALYPS